MIFELITSSVVHLRPCVHAVVSVVSWSATANLTRWAWPAFASYLPSPSLSDTAVRHALAPSDSGAYSPKLCQACDPPTTHARSIHDRGAIFCPARHTSLAAGRLVHRLAKRCMEGRRKGVLLTEHERAPVPSLRIHGNPQASSFPTRGTPRGGSRWQALSRAVSLPVGTPRPACFRRYHGFRMPGVRPFRSAISVLVRCSPVVLEHNTGIEEIVPCALPLLPSLY
jgi:hypothetical protein